MEPALPASAAPRSKASPAHHEELPESQVTTSFTLAQRPVGAEHQGPPSQTYISNDQMPREQGLKLNLTSRAPRQQQATARHARELHEPREDPLEEAEWQVATLVTTEMAVMTILAMAQTQMKTMSSDNSISISSLLVDGGLPTTIRPLWA